MQPIFGSAVLFDMDTLADALTYWTPARIKALRNKHGLTQDAWAPVIGYETKTSVSDLETGRSKPSRVACRLMDYIETHGVLPARDGDE